MLLMCRNISQERNKSATSVNWINVSSGSPRSTWRILQEQCEIGIDLLSKYQDPKWKRTRLHLCSTICGLRALKRNLRGPHAQ